MKHKELPRLLIEDWLPAAAIGVECIRERSTGQQPPDKRLHIWWARRPLAASRAAALGSLLPADFSRATFEKLLGFWGSSKQIIEAERSLDAARARGTNRIVNPHGERAFKQRLSKEHLTAAHQAVETLWGQDILVLDPMAGGGSIPLESVRLGFRTLANELNPVACSVLEATVDYPFRHGATAATKARIWGAELRKRFNKNMEGFFPAVKWNGQKMPPLTYIFARAVPCPDTGYDTPLVPDWHLLKPKGSKLRVWAEAHPDKKHGTWSVAIVDSRKSRGKKEPPNATYSDGKGISLFTGNQIPADYIKAKAQAGEMRSALYAIALKTTTGLEFTAPGEPDLKAIEQAEKILSTHRKKWEDGNIIPTELYPEMSSDERPRLYGMPHWADLFSSRQLLGLGTLVDQLHQLRPEIIKTEGKLLGEAIVHLLALVVDKFADYNAMSSIWHPSRGIIAHVFNKHDYSFKATYAEMAPCAAGMGLEWATESVVGAYEALSNLPRSNKVHNVQITQGSATNLPSIHDRTVTAIVVDPPYADNVQYSELADFFYVWLKRTQGYRRPEWFSTYLCDHTEEAVVNPARHKTDGMSTAEAKRKAHEFYQRLMTDTFKESHRILRDDGVLTVMFTHKKQEAWQALFGSLINAGFMITATWPVKTESEHSLHQAKKNAAQSTVILVARKRSADAEVGYFDAGMKKAIRLAAQKSAERLQKEGLNPVDQLVGSFGPAMEVYSRHSEVRTDTGDHVGVDRAIDEASEAVAAFRIKQLADRGLEGVEAEGRFYLLCWDVLQAAEFRFNEAKLLGNAVGMDVDTLVAAGLVSKSGEKIKVLSAKDRRRPKKLEQEEMEETLFGAALKKKKRVRAADALKVHPNDSHFRTSLDGCHALALRHAEAGGGKPGIGSARQLAVQQGWKGSSSVAKLMEALVKAAPAALWFEKGKKSVAAEYPEFRAWHELLEPVFGVEPPEWKKDLGPLELFAAGEDAREEEIPEEDESEENE